MGYLLLLPITMPKIEDHLTQIKDKIARGQREGPQRDLTELMGQMGRAELSDWRPDITNLIHQFQKKRRRDLLMALDSAAQNAPELSRVTSKELIQQGFIDPSSSLVVTFQRALDELAQRHIYQWSTFYRDCMATHLSLFVEKMQHIATHCTRSRRTRAF